MSKFPDDFENLEVRMGGYGSGRRSQKGALGAVEDCRVLDAFRFNREGILRFGFLATGRWEWSGSSSKSTIAYLLITRDPQNLRMTLMYTFTKTGEKMEYVVRLQTTSPYFGGLKWWFNCPLILNGRSCNRRVRKLYQPPGGKYFGCRECYGLRYSCQREDAKTRYLYKAQDIRARLGGSRSMIDRFPDKPKGMWWRTYDGLRNKSLEAEDASAQLVDIWMIGLEKRTRARASKAISNGFDAASSTRWDT